MKKKITWQRLLPMLIPILVLAVWQLLSVLKVIPTNILPAPSAVILDGIKLTQNGELTRNLTISLYRATIGFLIGGSIGFVLGLLNGLSRISNLLTDSSIQMFRNIPHLALIPMVILWFGIGESAKIFLVTIGVMFPIYINTLHGIQSVDPGLIEMGRVYQLNKRQLFSKIIFPGALPSILVGVRYALGVMWTTLIVAETIAADSGIGFMAMNAEDFMDMETIVLCIVIYAILGKLSDVIVKYLEEFLLDWQQTD
ncbi:ABC transporter permease subunit [Lapidilactobacillus mulanensis]|uniref:ABC transporter permease subunit n=1 Tax=Lapidilactobacillus mulanensis TaxID=2485999 RepID=A0ABW4DLV6_9LACO|nr:ABC transporter permease subunit [Lapidilactobacillus mulanensis]